MSHRSKIGILIFFSMTVVVIGYILRYSFEVGICPWDNSCIGPLFDLGYPLPIFFGGVLSSLVCLLPAKEAVFKTWLKFAIVFIPVSLIFIYSASMQCGQFVCLLTRDLVAWYMAILLVIISLLIIIIKSIRLAGKTEVAKTIENRK